ncbi:MAG: lipoyl(octanoyl) transferase LipB [Elusimicrobia bacterium]|nr:lipoyl(octanoyl) transferase LipB [Elusimicrobiota bacterium]MDE2237333.1 lipoyl(octanoyl) transferase LipB [Elusimicrobiota bacterium]MDE2426451.1 lipoyl(octanoyl) transferase LipB [Elusimicrobiota bacterium]
MLLRSLGLADYERVWALQKDLLARRRKNEIEDTVLLCEHPPVYTRGVSSKAPVPPSLPYPLHTVERGGDLTYHGPGQLVGYPILELSALGLRPRSYLRALEEVLIEAARALGLEAGTLRGFTGVWSGGRKIASIGVAVEGGVSYHGFALNVCCDLTPFSAIYPCNLQPDQMSTLRLALGRAVGLEEAQAAVAQALRLRLGRIGECVGP